MYRGWLHRNCHAQASTVLSTGSFQKSTSCAAPPSAVRPATYALTSARCAFSTFQLNSVTGLVPCTAKRQFSTYRHPRSGSVKRPEGFR